MACDRARADGTATFPSPPKPLCARPRLENTLTRTHCTVWLRTFEQEKISGNTKIRPRDRPSFATPHNSIMESARRNKIRSPLSRDLALRAARFLAAGVGRWWLEREPLSPKPLRA